ncbi:MAG: CRISPR-associated protein Cas5 [bacterium]
MKERLVVFDILGKIAHFRKFYTNSSSLTYDLPPPTVIRGMIAAILGIERDGYYDLLSPERTRIAASIHQPGRRFMQTINYIRTNKNDFSNPRHILARFLSGARVPYQVPMEVLLPLDQGSSLKYRIYFQHTDGAIMRMLKDQMASGFSVYPLYFGISEFIADFQYRGERDYELRQGIADRISSMVNGEKLNERGIDLCASQGCQFVKERMPAAFKQGRELLKVSSFIYERSGRPFTADVSEYAVVSSDDGLPDHIVFI